MWPVPELFKCPEHVHQIIPSALYFQAPPLSLSRKIIYLVLRIRQATVDRGAAWTALTNV
jgi:hypothetical protein